MPGAGDESDTETFEVVERIVQGMNLELAAIAGTGIDMPNAERTAQERTKRSCRPSRMRKLSSAAGGASVAMPMDAIWRRVFSMSVVTVSYRSWPL